MKRADDVLEFHRRGFLAEAALLSLSLSFSVASFSLRETRSWLRRINNA